MKRILFLVVVTILIVVTACAKAPTTCIPTIESKHNLKAITLDSNLEGHFFLLSGYIESEHTFSFYEITEDGAFHLRRVAAESALVYEDSTDEAWVVKKKGGYECSPPEIRETRSCVSTLSTEYCEWYEIHVPSGSIVQVIDLSIQK